jgi:hypothetical protein
MPSGCSKSLRLFLGCPGSLQQLSPNCMLQRSQKNPTILQHEQQRRCEWRQLRTCGVSKLTTLYWWLRTARWAKQILPWPWSMQFGDACYAASWLHLHHGARFRYLFILRRECVRLLKMFPTVFNVTDNINTLNLLSDAGTLLASWSCNQ